MKNQYYPMHYKNKIYNLAASYSKQYSNMKYNIADIQEEAFQESCLYYQTILHRLKDEVQANKYYSKTYQGKLIYHLHFIQIGARNRSQYPIQTISINTPVATYNNSKKTVTIGDTLTIDTIDTTDTDRQQAIKELLYSEVDNIKFSNTNKDKKQMLRDIITEYLIQIDRTSPKRDNRVIRYTVNNLIDKELIATRYNTTISVVNKTFLAYKKHIQKKYQKKSKIIFS